MPVNNLNGSGANKKMLQVLATAICNSYNSAITHCSQQLRGDLRFFIHRRDKKNGEFSQRNIYKTAFKYILHFIICSWSIQPRHFITGCT